MSNFTVANAPLFIETTIAGLQAAIVAAKSGTIITVPTVGDPLDMTLTAVVKPSYGITVILPLDQRITVTLSGSSGINFIGGFWSADEVRGTAISGNNGLELESASSRVSLRGAVIGFNHNGVRATGNSTDLLVSRVVVDGARSDCMHIFDVSRIEFSHNDILEGVKGRNFCYYNDGRAPVEGISSGACTGGGGVWNDTAHNDIVQAYKILSDLTVTNITAVGASQGIVTFGGIDPNRRQRILVAHNDLVLESSWGINIRGGDAEVRDNNSTATISLQRELEGDPIRGGRNTAPNVNTPPEFDLLGATVEGDDVVPPVRPQLIFAPWTPAIVRPPPPPQNFAPFYVAGGGIRWHGHAEPTPPVLGTWLSVSRGQWAGHLGATYEFRWTRNGTPITGATAQMYQVVSDDVGQAIRCEVRGTNATDTGDWQVFDPVTPV